MGFCLHGSSAAKEDGHCPGALFILTHCMFSTSVLERRTSLDPQMESEAGRRVALFDKENRPNLANIQSKEANKAKVPASTCLNSIKWQRGLVDAKLCVRVDCCKASFQLQHPLTCLRGHATS